VEGIGLKNFLKQREGAENMKTFKEAVEDLNVLGITGPQIYLLDIIPLVEMIWADGVAQASELTILNAYLHKRVEQIKKIAGYKVVDFENAWAFALRFIRKRPLPGFLRRLRSLVGPIILSSSDSQYVDSIVRRLIEACTDIAANAVRRYPDGLHDRFDEKERCFLEILKTFRNVEMVASLP
jgi:hypothetical protein